MATLVKRGNRWRAQIRRHGKSLSGSFGTKRDAQAWVAVTEAAIVKDDGNLPRRPSGTLAGLIDRYAAEIYPLKGWGTNKTYELAQLQADLGDLRLAEIDQPRIVGYALDLRKRLAASGVATRLSYLATVCRAGEDLWGLATPLAATEKAIAGLKRQRLLSRPLPRTRRPQAAEIDLIIAYAQNSKRMDVDLGAILGTLRLLPLRVGELLAIRWEDLCPADRAVIIRARKHPDSAVKVGNDYVVPLPVIDGIDTYPLIADRPRYLPRPFPWRREAVSSAFWVAAKACAIADLHLHDLRALAITRLLEAGVAIPLVAHLSGHRNWKILMRHYTRIGPEAIHNALARAAE
jgi:integrase